jgi:RNA polymerase sigma-70 factor (ECF subfamily)
MLGSKVLSPSDTLLLDRLRDGDQEAFAALFLAYYQPVYRLAFRTTGDREEAEDIAQEVFIRLYRQPLSRDRDHNLRAWLYRVALNQAFNSQRSSRRQSQRDERVASLEYTERVESDPAENALRAEQRRQVRIVLQTLAPRQQQILILRHEGCSYAEIAEVVEVAPSSIGTLLARAEAEFARRYQELFGGTDK